MTQPAPPGARRFALHLLPLRFRLIFFMLVRVLINTQHRMVYPLLPVFARALGVTPEALSGAIALRYATGALSPLLSWLGERTSRKAGMLLGMALFGLGSLFVLLFPTFHGFVAAIILTVLAKSALDPAMQAYLGDTVPFERRGQAVAVVELGWSLSFLLGIPAVGYLIDRGGWLAPFPLLLLMAILAMIGLAVALPGGVAAPGAGAPFWRSARAVLSSPAARAGLLLMVFISAANELVSIVFGTWLEGTFGLQLAALAGASFVIGGSELLGESLVGLLTDRLGKARAVRGGTLLNCLCAILLPVIARGPAGAFAGLFLFYVTFEFTLVSALTFLTEISREARATFLGLNMLGISAGRALADLAGLPLLGWGMAYVVAGTVALNLIGIACLGRIPIGEQAAPRGG
jgi:predicted MFS family arabinose efflux permease